LKNVKELDLKSFWYLQCNNATMNRQRLQIDKQVFTPTYICWMMCEFSSIPLKHKHVDAAIGGVNPVHYIASNQDVYKNN